jgi:hypothetical protein
LKSLLKKTMIKGLSVKVFKQARKSGITGYYVTIIAPKPVTITLTKMKNMLGIETKINKIFKILS